MKPNSYDSAHPSDNQAWCITRTKERESGYLGENMHVICTSRTREGAKSYAAPIIGGNPDQYICNPITAPGEPVFLFGKLL